MADQPKQQVNWTSVEKLAFFPQCANLFSHLLQEIQFTLMDQDPGIQAHRAVSKSLVDGLILVPFSDERNCLHLGCCYRRICFVKCNQIWSENTKTQKMNAKCWGKSCSFRLTAKTTHASGFPLLQTFLSSLCSSFPWIVQLHITHYHPTSTSRWPMAIPGVTLTGLIC